MMSVSNARTALRNAQVVVDRAERELNAALESKQPYEPPLHLENLRAVELLTLDYSPLLNELDEPHLSVPLVVQLNAIDTVYKSSKRKRIGASPKTSRALKERSKLSDCELMPPPPPLKRRVMEPPMPKEFESDALARRLMCHDDCGFLFE